MSVKRPQAVGTREQSPRCGAAGFTLGDLDSATPLDALQNAHSTEAVTWDEQANAWMVVGYDAVKELSRDDGTAFRRPWEIPELNRGSLMSEADWAEFQSLGSQRHIFRIFGPERTTQHAWWVRTLSPQALAPWAENLMRPLADAQLDQIANGRAADLFSDYAVPVPLRVTAAILGAPTDDQWIAAMRQATQARAALRQYRGGGDPAADIVAGARQATAQMLDLLAPVVEKGKASPRSDLISILWRDGEGLFGPGFGPVDVAGAASMVWEAGTWTISLATANALHMLATNPELQRALRVAEADLRARFVEETFRLLGPVHARTERVAVTAARIGGVHIRPGDRVIAITGAAGRDPERYPNPAGLRLDRRAPRDHFAFWKGPMVCLGQGMSRMQVRVNVDAVLERLEDLRLDPVRTAPVYAGQTVRGWRPLPMTFEPRASVGERNLDAG